MSSSPTNNLVQEYSMDFPFMIHTDESKDTQSSPPGGAQVIRNSSSPTVAHLPPKSSDSFHDTSIESSSFLDQGIILQMVTLMSATEKDAAVQWTEMFLWYVEQDSDLGTLYWTFEKEGDPGKHKISPGPQHQCIQIHLLRDVFLGKQMSPFTSTSLSCVDANRCLSLVTKNYRQCLHLVAENSILRDALLRELIQSITTRLNPASILEKGDTFFGYFGTNPTVRIEILVFFDASEGKYGTLYHTLSTCVKHKNNKNSIRLHRITDIFMGKQTAEMISDVAKTVSSSLCFSLVTPDKEESMHLEAKTSHMKNTWINCLRNIFQFHKKTVENSNHQVRAS